MTTFSSEQLNFFKFSTVVFEEFPIALRQVFADLWDTLVAPLPGFKKWDDSLLVRNLFLNKEGGKTRYVPTSKSYHDWDCTALFEATLYSKSCSVSDGKGGFATLAKMYVTPRGVPGGLFHPSVLSPSGNKAETYALALDQLRRLRNTLCHQISTKEIVKADFDNYIRLAKDAFRALGLKSTKIDDVGRLGEKDFPTARLQQLEEELRAERFKPIEDILDKMRFDGTEIKRDVIDVKTKVADVETEVKTVVTVLKETVTDVQTKLEDVGSDVKAAVTDVQTKVEVVGSDVKAAVTDVQTKVEVVGSDVKTAVTDVKATVTDVQTKMEDVGSDVKTAVTDVQKKIEDVESDVKTAVTDVKVAVTDVQTKMEDVGSDVKTAVTDVKAAVTDVQTKLEDVGSDVKTAVTDVQTKIEDVESDVKTAVTDVKAAVTDVQRKIEDVGSDVKTAVTDVKEAVSDVGFSIDRMRQAMQNRVLQGSNVPQSCIPDKIPHFFGRQEECKEIQNHLTAGKTRIVNVWGPPAFGKTSVAINVAHLLGEMNIPVYFLPLRGMTSKEELVSKLLSIFADDNRLRDISPSHWLIKCLQRVQSRFVLIFDNADDLLESEDDKRKEDVLQFIKEILAQCSHIKLLLTTRASLDFLDLTLSLHLVKINVLDEISSASLIKVLLPDVTEDDCKCIIKECGQVPLAVRLMCNILKEEHTSVRELSEDLRNSTILEVLDNEYFPSDARLKLLINKSFQRLPIRERKAFVSLTVFPGWFDTKEATAVLDVKTERTTKKVIHSLERNSLIDCGESFSCFTIHSLFRSFVDEQRRKDETIEAIFRSAQQHFYDYNISSLENANEKFLMGPSNESLSVFLGRRENILLSINNGIKDDDLYSKVVKVLSTAELFLYAVLRNEEVMFQRLYDTALLEAKRRQIVEDELMLLAAKSFRHWGWFSLDCQTWEDSLSADYSNKAYCPAKLLCYQSIHQLLCGNREEGIMSLFSAVDRLNCCCIDEIVLKHLIFFMLTNFLNSEEKDAPQFRKLQDQSEIYWKSRYSRIFSGLSETDSGDNIVDTVLEHKDLFFINVSGNLLFVTNAYEIQDEERYRALSFALNKFLPAICENQVRNTNTSDVPYEIRIFTALFKESLEPLLILFSESNWFTLESATQTQLESLRLHFLEFTEQISQSGVNSVESYVATKQFIEIILHCLELFPDFSSSAKSDTFFENVFKYFTDTFDDVLKHSSKRVPGTDLLELARGYDRLGKLKKLFIDSSAAIESHEEAIRIRQKHFGNHIDTVASLIDIGCSYLEMNKVIEAGKALESALDLRKQLGVYDHEDTAYIYASIGENQSTLANYEEALNAFLEAAKIRKEHLGQHPLTAKALNEAGRVYFKLQSYPEALQFCEQAFNMRLDLSGEDVDTADSFNLLGCIHFKMGENALAIQSFEVAAEMRTKLLGYHKDTAWSYHNLGVVQSELGDQHGALDSLQKAADIRSKQLGSHVDTASSYHWLGVVQRDMGDLRGALVSLRKATDMRSKKLGSHVETASSYHLLGVVQLNVGDLRGARGSLKKAADMRSKKHGSHVDTASSYHWLGVVQREMGDFDGALKSLTKAADMRSKELGDHKDTASSYHLLGIVQRHMGEDIPGALGTLEKAAIMRSNLLGDHEDTADSYHNVGAVQYLMGDHKKASEFLQRAAHMRSNLPGDQKNTASTYHLLGSVQYDMKDIDSAVESLQMAWQLRDELLGENHPDTVDTLQLLSRACEASLLHS